MRSGRDIDKQLAGGLALARLSNAELAEHAAMEIEGELAYACRLIRVAVCGGWVTLEGDVEWSYQKNGAETAVRRIPWVKGISNDLHLQPRPEAADVERRIEAALRSVPPHGGGARMHAWAA